MILFPLSQQQKREGELSKVIAPHHTQFVLIG